MQRKCGKDVNDGAVTQDGQERDGIAADGIELSLTTRLYANVSFPTHVARKKRHLSFSKIT